MQEKYFVFIALAFLAEIIGTVSGFGSSILFVPLASLFFDLKTVLGITAVFHVFSNLSKIALFREGIDRNIALKLGLPAVIAVIIGAWLTTMIDTQWLELGMNFMLVALAIFMMVRFHKTIEQSNRNLYTGGILSGLMAGLVGTGGAIRGITLAAFQLPKYLFIATSAFIDLGVDSSRAVVYVANGYFQKEHLVLVPFLIGISVVGSYTGKKILEYTSERIFRYIVLGVVILTSLYQVIKFVLS